ncbi:hypothetical protein N2152v2_007369 [Parachlorella kessleri]
MAVVDVEVLSGKCMQASVLIVLANREPTGVRLTGFPALRQVRAGVTTAAVDAATKAIDPEVKKAYSRVQNGSDVRGITLDILPGESVNLTPSMMFFIGAAFADWLSDALDKPPTALSVSVGRDSRLSSPLIKASILAGLASQGVRVANLSLCTTPAMFMSCVLPDYLYDGAVMVTASHLPINRNGAKFCTAKGGLEKKDITWLLTRATELSATAGVKPLDRFTGDAWVVSGALLASNELVSQQNFLQVYAVYMQELIRRGINHPTEYDTPLKGFKIVVNPGNGGGGFIATHVLGPLGADVSGSINLQPDGWFPNHTPNPEDKKAVEATRKAVLEQVKEKALSEVQGADLGIMLDTDVDRSGVVDRHGNGINRNRYIALMSAITLRENPGQTIVTDSCTSNGLAAFIAQLGGTHFRFRKGYKNIINKGIELNNSGVPCPLMMETSGHGAMRENYFLDDGAYGALKIVIEMVRRRLAGESDIADLLKELREPAEAMEIRVRLTAEDVRAEGEKVTAEFKKWLDAGADGAQHWDLERENYEGWRVKVHEGDGKEGWVLLRPSLHDPDIVLNVESEVPGGMRAILSHLLNFFRANPGFQVSTALVEDYVSKQP